MSLADHNDDRWSESAVRTRSEWARLRMLALEALDAFGCRSEEPPPPRDAFIPGLRTLTIRLHGTGSQACFQHTPQVPVAAATPEPRRSAATLIVGSRMEVAPERPTFGFFLRVFGVALLLSTVVGLLLTALIGERAAGAVRLALMLAIVFLASPDWRQRPIRPYLIHGAFILVLSFLTEYLLMPYFL